MIEDFDNVSYYWPKVYKEHKNYAIQEWFVFIVIFKKNSRLEAYQKHFQYVNRDFLQMHKK